MDFLSIHRKSSWLDFIYFYLKELKLKARRNKYIYKSKILEPIKDRFSAEDDRANEMLELNICHHQASLDESKPKSSSNDIQENIYEELDVYDNINATTLKEQPIYKELSCRLSNDYFDVNFSPESKSRLL